MKIFCAFEKPKLYFDQPVSLITCSCFSDVARTFEKIEEALSHGFYVAGFFRMNLVTRLRKNFPLIVLTTSLLSMRVASKILKFIMVNLLSIAIPVK